MLVSSAFNPSIRSSVHLFIIHYSEDSVLVPVDPYAKYTDLQDFVAKEWTLEKESIILETDELDVCSGKRIRIHEEAWIGVKDIVGNVHVRVRNSPRSMTQDRGQYDLLGPSVKHEPKREDLLTSREPSESADEAEVEHQTMTDIPKSEYLAVTPTGSIRDQDAKEERHGRSDVPLQSPRKPRPVGDTLNLFNDEVDANTGEEDGEPIKEKELATKTSVAMESTTGHKLTWKQLLGSVNRATSDKPPNSASTITSGSTFATSTPTPILRSAGDAKMKSELTQPSTDGATSGDPERVLIVVEPPLDSIYETRGFRIRREHSVRTVLKGASKAFKIDHTKARLRMVIDEDEQGELITVKCNDSETMNSLKVEDNQRFIIVMGGEDEDEEGESDG